MKKQKNARFKKQPQRWIPHTAKAALKDSVYLRITNEFQSTTFDEIDVRIDDMIPSAERLYNDIDIALWGIVQLVVLRSERAVKALAEKALDSENDEKTLMVAFGLPLALGKAPKNKVKKRSNLDELDFPKSKRNKLNLPKPPNLTEKLSQDERHKPAPMCFESSSLATCHRNALFGRYLRPLTANAALVLGDFNAEPQGCWLPAKVLGVGPNSTINDPTVLVTLLTASPAGAIGNPPRELRRNASCLRLLNDCKDESNEQTWREVYWLMQREEYASFDRGNTCSYYLKVVPSAAGTIVTGARLTRDSATLGGVDPKYWDQRYRLLPTWDRGCLLDKESWYSFTPEPVATWLAKRCSEAWRLYRPNKSLGTSLDLFSGCGGCTFSLSGYSERVLAIDADPLKHELAVHNARLCLPHPAAVSSIDDASIHSSITYSNCTFLAADVYDVLNRLPDLPLCSTSAPPAPKAGLESPEVIVMCPPWGGPAYLSGPFDLRTLPSGCGVTLLQLALRKCLHVCYVLPRNVPRKQLRRAVRAAYRARSKETDMGAESDPNDHESEGNTASPANGASLAADIEWSKEYLIENLYLYDKFKLTVLYVGPGFRSIRTAMKHLLLAGAVQTEEVEEMPSDVPTVGGKAALIANSQPLLHLRFSED